MPSSTHNRLNAGAARAVALFVFLSAAAFSRDGLSQENAEPGAQKSRESLSEFLLLQKANQFAQNKEYQKAIPILEQLVSARPDDKNMKSLLARTYIAQGHALQSSGKLDQSIEMLGKSRKIIDELADAEGYADSNELEYRNQEREEVNLKGYLAGGGEAFSRQAIADEKARTLLKQASDSYKDKQYQLTKTLTRQALEHQPDNALAHELLGDAEYFSQNLTAAKEAYEKSFRKDAHPRVKEKLEKITKEISLESSFAEYADERFLIRYKRSERFEGSEIRQHLRDSYREVSRDFGHYLNYKTVVILYGKGEYETVQNMPHWSGAMYDGKIRIPIYDEKANSKNLRKYIQHELAHVFIIDLSGHLCPVWLHEGIAQYQENKIVPIDLTFFKRAVKSGALLSMADLEQGVSKIKDQAGAILFYHQSFSMAEYLIEKYRFFKIKALLKQLAQKTPFHDAFKQVMGVSVQEFYSEWHKAVTQKFS